MEDPKRFDAMREMLLEKRHSIQRMISRIRRNTLEENSGEETGEISRVRLHPADLGTMASEQASGLGIVDQETTALNAIDDALDKLDSGEYGTCEECGDEIPLARLQAQPFARFCVECQEDAEAATRTHREPARKSAATAVPATPSPARNQPRAGKIDPEAGKNGSRGPMVA